MAQYKTSFKLVGEILVEAESASEAMQTARELVGDANNDLGEIIYDVTDVEEIPEEESDDEEIAADDVMATIAATLEERELSDIDVIEGDGQLIFETGIYKWADGTFHTTPKN